MSVVIETTLGDITVDLYLKERPQTCLNFIKLCKLKYYNLCLFHSINANFCAQTGDQTGKGDGGESIHGLLKGETFRFYQAENQPKMKHDRTGLLSMVSHGQGMLGSQFLITLSPDLSSLDGEHCVFGEVVEGSEVLLKLNEAITDEQHRPYQDIRITHTVVLEDPFPDPDGMISIPPSPSHPSTKDAAYSRIPADEPLSESCTQEELNEMVQAREAAARATILEMVGDLPDADVAPPENVLFVCKLNPVTTDHDLSLIFSRFGKVKSCEVIRDAKSGDSLQYAFVEFEDKKACEQAYFKMDNVLIDERRIHVDFSQSVARWRGKGKGVEMLGPTPQGGWGNKNRTNQKNNKWKDDDSFLRKEKVNNSRLAQSKEQTNEETESSRRKSRGLCYEKKVKSERSPEPQRLRNESKTSTAASKNKIITKKEVSRKRRRRSPSTSSSSTSSMSSESSSSSESSDTEPARKKSRGRKTEKVLVVVKTPRGRKSKKNKKTQKKSRKYESESEDIPKKKKKKLRKRSSRSTSSSVESYAAKKKKRKRRSSVSEDCGKRKKGKKRAETSESSSEEPSRDKVVTKQIKKLVKKKKRVSDDSSEAEFKKRKKQGKHVRKSTKRRRPPTSSSASESSSSSSESD